MLFLVHQCGGIWRNVCRRRSCRSFRPAWGPILTRFNTFSKSGSDGSWVDAGSRRCAMLCVRYRSGPTPTRSVSATPPPLAGKVHFRPMDLEPERWAEVRHEYRGPVHERARRYRSLLVGGGGLCWKGFKGVPAAPAQDPLCENIRSQGRVGVSHSPIV